MKSHSNVKSIRGTGLLISIDLKENVSVRKMCQERIASIQNMLAINGVLVYRSFAGLTLMPMLNIRKEESNLLVNKLISFFKGRVF